MIDPALSESVGEGGWKRGLRGAAKRAAKAKRHQRASERRALERRRIRKSFGHPGLSPQRVHRRNIVRREIENKVTGVAHIAFPEQFDLINNYEETVATLAELRKQTCDFPAKTVYVDHSKIQKLSPEAVVVLLAEMMRSDNYSPKTMKMCIRPNSADACEILWKTGYMRHFENQAPLLKSEKEYVRYVTFDQRKQRQAKNLVDHFTPACGFDVDATKALKVAIAECMDNVMKHAYQPPGPKQIVNRWWMLGSRDTTTHECYFCFYDHGNGIPGTIRVRFSDLFPLIQPTDSEMIAKGIDGHYSRTKDAGRGTGMPTFMEFINTSKDGQLLILSGKGRYSFAKGKRPEYADNVTELPGTLIVWTIRT